MYAIKNNKTGKWVYGTDYNYRPPKQRTSKEQAITFDEERLAQSEFNNRRCGKHYEVVEVTLKEVSKDFTRHTGVGSNPPPATRSPGPPGKIKASDNNG